jgi:hypothetical protein
MLKIQFTKNILDFLQFGIIFDVFLFYRESTYKFHILLIHNQSPNDFAISPVTGKTKFALDLE